MDRRGFTLAEVLITLGIIGVVTALTLPLLITNVQLRIRSEQIRTAKYKFTKATDKMNSLGLIGPYDNTQAFVNELQKHLKLVKVCDSAHLKGCWPTETVRLTDGSDWDIGKTVSGKELKMETTDSTDYTSQNVGIVTADGVPMILSYNSKCVALDPVKEYGWTTEDNKPVSNATAGCVAAVMDINGNKKPNGLNKDVILFNANGLGSSCGIEIGNSCYSSLFSPIPVTESECNAMMADGTYGLEGCGVDIDYFAGAAKTCGGVNNLMSEADYMAIRNIIYTNIVHFQPWVYHSDKAIAMGLPAAPEPDTDGYVIYANSFHGEGYASAFHFLRSMSDVNSGNRSDSSIFATCLIN